MKKLFFLSLLAMILFSSVARAGQRYWISTTTSNWNNTANWSTTDGGAGGSAVPGSTDTVHFTSTRTGQCDLDVNADVKRIEMGSGCGTLTQSTYSITVGTSGGSLAGGTFTGGSGAITFSGVCTNSGCAFTSTSGTFSTNSNFTVNGTGSFTHNNGLLRFTASNTITGSITCYDLEFAPAATSIYTIASGTTLTVTATLTFSGSSSLTVNTGTISARGNVTVTNNVNAGGGNATLTLAGGANQSFTGGSLGATGRMPNVTINKSGGTLSLLNTIAVGGGWTYTAGTLSTGTSRVHFIGNKTISGTHALYDIRFGAGAVYTIASGTILTCTGDIVYGSDNTGSVRINTGTIYSEGDIELKNPVNGGGGTGTIVMNGTGSQTISGNATEGTSALPNLTINKSSGTLTLDSVITVAGNWTYTTGTLSATSANTVCFWDTKTIGGTSHSLPRVSFNSSTTAIYTVSGGFTLTVTGLLSLKGSSQLTFNTGTINVTGNISLANTANSNAAGGSASLVVNGTANQTITGNSTKGNSRLPNVTINKSSDTLFLVNTISVQGDFTYTAGTVSPGTSTVHFAGDKTITGSLTLYTISFGGSSNFTYTIASGTVLTANGNLETSGGSNITINTGDIRVHRNITVANTGSGGGGDATITLNDTLNQTFTGSGTVGLGRLPNIVIDKTGSGVLTLASVISCAGNWTYTGSGANRVSPGSSTVAFYGTFNLDGQQPGSTNTMAFNNVSINTGTRTLTGNVNADGNFTIVSGATCSAGSNTIFVGGNWNSAGTWTYGTSAVVFDGNGYNKVEGATGTINFASVTLSRNTSPGTTSKNLRLLNPVLINTAMTLNKGRIYSTTTNYLAFADNATCTVTNDDSAYVHGPVRKTGNDAFTFPLGDTTLHDSIAYHPLAMTAPGNASDRFEAAYYAAGQTLGSTLVDTLTSISDCEYWTIEKQNGSSNVTVKVYWNQNSCGVDNYDDLRMAGWLSSGSKWIDLGVSDLSPGFPTGNLSSGSAINFGTQTVWPIVIGQRPNFTPYAVLKRKLDAGYYQCSNGKLMFRFQDEYNDPDAKLSFRIYNDQYGLMTSDQIISAGSVPDVYYGSNYYLLNVLDCNVVPNGNVLNGFFILEVINEKGERWYLRFKHTTSLNPNCEGSEPTE